MDKIYLVWYMLLNLHCNLLICLMLCFEFSLLESTYCPLDLQKVLGHTIHVWHKCKSKKCYWLTDLFFWGIPKWCPLLLEIYIRVSFKNHHWKLGLIGQSWPLFSKISFPSLIGNIQLATSGPARYEGAKHSTEWVKIDSIYVPILVHYIVYF